MKAKEFIENLRLKAHPEGGHFGEFYRSAQTAFSKEIGAERSFCTSIYFLLQEGEFSALHKIKSDEIWHFYAGDPLEIIEITPEGQFKITLLGPNLGKGQLLTYVVPAGNWFGSRPATGGSFSLVGCTVSPGFDFADFEMPGRDHFLQIFPQHQAIILEMTRP